MRASGILLLVAVAVAVAGCGQPASLVGHYAGSILFNDGRSDELVLSVDSVDE